MPKVCVWFYNPCNDTSGLINKLVSRLDPPFCHCEVQFQDGQACSIYMGCKAVMKCRSFESSCYTPVVLDCSGPEYDAMYACARTYADSAVSFSTLKMTASLMWLPTPTPERHTFCSELCANVIRAGGRMLANVEPAKLTPSGLHRVLAEIEPVPVPLTAVAIDFK